MVQVTSCMNCQHETNADRSVETLNCYCRFCHELFVQYTQL